MEAPIYNASGKVTGTIGLPDNVFGVPWNDSLMHQVITSMQSNARLPVAHTKMRGEVRGGGRKPWQQKGTGRARHGSIRSPIWRGGGVTHGPRSEKNYSRRIPRSMRAKALFMALSQKLHDGEILFLDSFGFSEPKTSAAKKTLISLSKISGAERLATKKQNAALIATSGGGEEIIKSFRNIGNVTAIDVRNLNPLSVLTSTYLVIENPAEAIETISKRSFSDK